MNAMVESIRANSLVFSFPWDQGQRYSAVITEFDHSLVKNSESAPSAPIFTSQAVGKMENLLTYHQSKYRCNIPRGSKGYDRLYDIKFMSSLYEFKTGTY